MRVWVKITEMYRAKIDPETPMVEMVPAAEYDALKKEFDTVSEVATRAALSLSEALKSLKILMEMKKK